MLLIDNLAANYWVDRACRALPGGGAGAATGAGSSAPTLRLVHTAAVAHVKALMRQHRVLLVVTKWTTSVASGGEDSRPWWQQQRDFVPNCWQDLITYKLAVDVAGLQRAVAKWKVPPGEGTVEFAVA